MRVTKKELLDALEWLCYENIILCHPYEIFTDYRCTIGLDIVGQSAEDAIKKGWEDPYG